ncbi:MAG: type II toxin-antitoxin system HicA family toxin [Ignavibacteriae bacterium]|nr:type II toxin-antitoxin system HicA family toxin [Ignavibacteriota bacterium]
MKTAEFLKELRAEGCYFKRHGKKHDIWVNPKTKKSAPVPRHTEIKNSLCELIRKQMGFSSTQH